MAVVNKSIIGQGDIFGLGMLAAVIILAANRFTEAQLRTTRIATWAALLVSSAGVLAIGSGEYATPFMAAIFASLVVLTQLPRSDTFSRILVRAMESPIPRLAGDYSLSSYLWHYPVIWFLFKHADWVRYDTDAELALSFATVVAVTTLLSVITYNLVEKPAMRKKRSTDRSPSAATPAS